MKNTKTVAVSTGSILALIIALLVFLWIREEV